ncbi:TlpA family protein disulfide reductase [Pedobacter ginsengisoli]|uniref:TlpA family protein disulfide reductase n=1 Tax=Pedobacter ginsengisoli TaxID=363852 RepID=UPI0025515AB9|nr:TlpA disulfide reductase family protein [Pedobacter ginsengisoli]
MKVKLIYLVAIVATSLQSFAQNSLKIGQQLPDLEINKILYHKSEKVKLSDFKGKLILLDFWSTVCGPCIAGMPKMDSLQKHFGDKIAILPIYPDLKGGMDNKLVTDLDSFWHSNDILSKTSLPSILDDEFARHFPARVAYQVWIDSKRVVRAITSSEYVNKKEIQKMLDGIYPDWETEIYTFYDDKHPIFKETRNYLNKDQFHSEFSGYIGGINDNKDRINGYQGIVDDKVSSSLRFSALNMDIVYLYRSLISKLTGNISLSNSKVIVETSDSSKYFINTYMNEWCRKNTYCYEAVFPKSESKDKVQQKMIKDLNSRLGLNARFEKRLVNCWTLKKNSAFGKRQYQEKGSSYEKMKDLVSDVQYITGLKVFDETSIKDKIDVKLNDTTTDQIISQLKQQGLDLVKEQRLLEVFVITDKSFKSTI